MAKIKLATLLLALLLPAALYGSAAHVYITQNGAGAKDGTSLANAGACDAVANTPQATCAFFNNAANWGSGSTQIGPGTIVHLSGTINAAQSTTASYFLFMGGGSDASHKITLLFDDGAVVTSPAFNVAVNISSQSYIVVDGGTNGVIRNTNNGASSRGKSYHQASQGVHVQGAYYIEIKNLNIYDIYLNGGNVSTETDLSGAGTQNIRVEGAGGNVEIHHNITNSARTGIDVAYTTSFSNLNIHHNSSADHCWGIRLAENSGGAVTSGNFWIHDNTITDWTYWQYPGATYHSDGIIIYGQQNSDLHVDVFNNYEYGNLGANPTAFVFITYGNAAPGASADIYNNLFVCTLGYPIWLKSGRLNRVYNNTASGPGTVVMIETAATTAEFKNNIFRAGTQVFASYSDIRNQVLASNHNVFTWNNNTQTGNFAKFNDGGVWITYATWQSYNLGGGGAASDSLSATADPGLDANYRIQNTSSPAYDRGENLTSLGINALNLDKDGNARPGTGAWDAGVYEYGGTPPPPPDPSAINVLQTKACGPETFDPTTGGKCAITATTAGSMIVVAYGSYNSAGSTPVINSISDNGGTSTYQQASGARAVNTASGQTSWNDMWYAANVASGITELTIKTSTSQTGDVFIWEVSNVNALDVAGHLDSQAASTTPVSPSLTTTAAKTFIAALVHPQPAHPPTGIHSGNVFTSDAVNDGMGAAHYTASSAGTYQAQWDVATAGVYASMAAAFKWQEGLATAVPIFLPGGGTYFSAQNVSISSTTSGATLCYTTDDSDPTADGNGTCTHGTTYTAPVLVSSSLTLKARASAAGYSDSAVASAAYTIQPVRVGMTLRGVTIKGVVVE